MSVESRVAREKELSPFGLACKRFGPWGMIKGRLLADIIGEEKALSMITGVKVQDDFKRLNSSISSYLHAKLASLNEKNKQDFLENEAERITEDIKIPETRTKKMLICENGVIIVPSSWGHYLNSLYGDPFSWEGGEFTNKWVDPTHDNESQYFFH